MKTRLFFWGLLLLAVAPPRLVAQDGDPIHQNGGGGGSGGGGGGGGSNGQDNDDWNAWVYCDDPDQRPPSIFASRKLADVTIRCSEQIPEIPSVWASDRCDGGCAVDFIETSRGPCPTVIERSWTSSDTKGNKKTRSEKITVDDSPPRIEIASEVRLEAEDCGSAILPNYTDAVIKDCDVRYCDQAPAPGEIYRVGEKIPVTLYAANECRETNKTFTVVVVCKGCRDCSAGNGEPENGSINLNLSLGRLANGRSAGHLTLYAQQPDARVFSPEALRYYKEGMGAETLRDKHGWLRQIRSADVLVDIVTNNGFQFSYDIRFYSPANWGSLDKSGLYVPSGPEHLAWQVFAPQALPCDGGTIAYSNRVMLSKVIGGGWTRYEYLFDEEQKGWRLTSGMRFHQKNTNRPFYWDHGLKVESRSSAWTPDGAMRTETYSIAGRTSGPAVYLEINEYRRFPWGEARVKTIRGEGDSARITERGFYEDPLQPSRYARQAWARQPDGNFTWYEYDAEGRVAMEARAWKDVDVPVLESNALMASASVTLFDFTPVDSLDDGSAQPRKPRTIIALAAGVVVSKTLYSFVSDPSGEVSEIREQCASSTAGFGDAGNLRTRTVLYSDAAGWWPGQIKSVEYPDGRLDRHVLERGRLTNSSPWSFSPCDTGDHVRTTLIHGSTLHPEGDGKTTREVSIRDGLGKDVLRETYVYNGANRYVSVDWTLLEYDGRGHLTAEYFANGLSRSHLWSDCCGKEADVDMDGTRTIYEYDALGRLESRIKVGLPKISSVTTPGYPEQPDLVTSYSRDAAGNILTESQIARVIQTNQTPDGVATQEVVKASMSTRNRYDLAGNLVETLDASQLLTRYEVAEDGRVTTVVRPGGAIEITESYPDGRTKSVTGTGVVPRFFDYGVNPDGSQWTMVHMGMSNSPMWEKTTTDLLGRSIREEKPGFGGTLLTTTYEYNGKGQLAATMQSAGNPPSVPVGVATLQEYDEFGDLVRTALDVNGNGIIDLAGPDRVTETQTRIVAISGERWRETRSKVYAADGDTTPVTLSVQRRTMTGGGSGSSTVNSESEDVRGQKIATTYAVDPANLLVKITRNPPDSTVDSVSVVRNGLLHSTRPSIWRDPTYYAYDGLGRQVMVTDPRTGEHLTIYDSNNQIEKTRDGAGNWTTNAYDPDSGLRIGVIDALGNAVHTDYDLQGRPTNVWGATTPVAYEYDDYGRMSVLKTWRDPGDDPDVTRWLYDEATGLLTNKVYADGNGTSYAYDASGRLTRRTWARGVATEYAYDALGQLTNIDYSDDTPDVSFTYDRMGRQVTVTDVLGTRTNVYDPSTFDLAAERLPDGQILSRSHDCFGRPTGIALSNGYRAAYAYDDAGRFEMLTFTVPSATTAVQYAYLAQSDLVSGWTIWDLSDRQVPSLIVKRSFEPRRDLVSSIVNTSSVALVSRFDYGHDRLGRRTARNDYTSRVVSAFNVFGYNSRSELTTATMGTNRFGYQYDAIGNRESAVANSRTNRYEVNVLNQYSSILPSAGRPAYDLDGNMISNSAFTFAWDAENRLVKVVSNGVVRVRNTYDYMGRRVRKIAGSTTTTFLYDGWSLICEEAGTNRFSYLWGLDLSGSLQGAGGVGGLLAQAKHTATGSSTNLNSVFLFAADANGNITDALNRTNHAHRVRYPYDPFGNLLAPLNSAMRDCKFRFSSKYHDDESGLYYYGYRFYSPAMGRWISRDPIEEEGGLSLYGHTSNDPVNEIDPLGESLFAIDGTWRDDEGKTSNISNIRDIYNKSKEETTLYYSGPGTKGGPIGHINGLITGAGSAGIANSVYADACAAYCKGQCEINLVGWSRGAVIAVNVADMLNARGCPCQSAPVSVNFVGLYDAVEMMPGRGSRSVPPNVNHFAHAIKTGSQLLFPTRPYGGNERQFDLSIPRHIRERVRVGTGKGSSWRWHDYWTSKSTHNDIGASSTATGAHDWIMSEARVAGVDF